MYACKVKALTRKRFSIRGSFFYKKSLLFDMFASSISIKWRCISKIARRFLNEITKSISSLVLNMSNFFIATRVVHLHFLICPDKALTLEHPCYFFTSWEGEVNAIHFVDTRTLGIKRGRFLITSCQTTSHHTCLIKMRVERVII